MVQREFSFCLWAIMVAIALFFFKRRWWQIPSWFPEFHGFARSLIIRGLHEYSMRSCFELLYHQMYHHVSRPPSTNLNYAADHFAQTQTGGNFKIRNIWFSYKTFLLPSRFFFAAIQKRERSLLVCSGNWKLVDRHKGAKELIWEEPIYGRNYTRLLFFLFFILSLYMGSIPNCNGVFSICFIFCQSKTRN